MREGKYKKGTLSMVSKEHQILGLDGHPLSKRIDEKTLPLEIQALVEARVNTAMDVARENLRSEINSAMRSSNIRSLIRYALLLIANGFAGWWLWLYGPAEVKEWTRTFVAENMNKPSLESAAKAVVAEKMDEFASEKIKPISEQFNFLNTAIDEAQKRLKRLQDEQRVIAIVNRAETFDKDALAELELLSREKTEVAGLASSMLRKVQRSLLLDQAAITKLIPAEIKEGSAIFTGPFTNDELAMKLTHPNTTEAAINEIGERKLLLFVPVLVEIAQKSNDLWVINRVSKALKNMVDVDFFPWEIKPLNLWWEKNSKNYKNMWPFEEHIKAEIAYRSSKYSDALQAFETVLTIDPAADRCRALAVTCAIELGDLPKAQKLNAGYSQKEGRWAQLAKCKMLLSTDTVEKATKEFAALSKKFPTFVDQVKINEKNPILKELDWSLYSELMKPSDRSGSIKKSE